MAYGTFAISLRQRKKQDRYANKETIFSPWIVFKNKLMQFNETGLNCMEINLELLNTHYFINFGFGTQHTTLVL